MKKEKTVIQVVQHLMPGGLENMALSLMDKSKDNQKNILISLDGDYDSCLQKWQKIESYKEDIIFLGKGRGFSTFAILKLWFLFIKIRPDVVHTHHIGPLFYGGIAALLAGVKSKIHSEHDAWHLNDNKSLILQTKIINILKPKMVAVSEIVADTLKDKIPESNPITISNGIDTQEFKPFSKTISRSFLYLPRDKVIIGSAGRLVDIKGHKYLIESLKNFDESICLAIAGDGDLKNELIRLVDELNLTHRVFFLGHVDEMKNFYNAIDVFCLPSLAEGLPLALLEAQACNIPCVASDVGGCKEVISDLSGSLAEAGNVSNLSQSIQEVLKKLKKYKPRQFVQSYGDAVQMTVAYDNLSS